MSSNSNSQTTQLTGDQLRQKYLEFFKKHGHTVIPSSPLVPENDPTTLFTGSGMQPMINYLLGQPHPKGNRIVDSQKCFRSQDIDDVGDNRHTTFFEMLGNWSLGDYFKEEQLKWWFEFMTKEVGLDSKKLYVSVYRGDESLGIDRDDEAIKIWKKLFTERGIEAKDMDGAKSEMKDGYLIGRIFYYGNENWWSRVGAPENMPVGEPGGPDSETFYDFGPELKLHESSKWKTQACHINCDCGRYLEIGNSVFMQYLKTEKGFEDLPQKNIDFGGGLERILAINNNTTDVFKTDLFIPIIKKLEELTGVKYDDNVEPFRVVADHLKAAVMLIADGVEPSNKDQGYFVRRLLRRSVRYGKKLGMSGVFLSELVPAVIKIYEKSYPLVIASTDKIKNSVEREEQKFLKTLEKGLKEFQKKTEKTKTLTAELAFTLFETYGFPLELSAEEAEREEFKIEENLENKFQDLKQKHAEKSRTASVGKFKGGLQDHSEVTVKYHTATHLLHSALRKILGDHVQQKGSNINDKRLRFDFTHPEALTSEEKQAIEKQINDWVKLDLPMTSKTMNKQAALDAGALAFFVEKYPDEVSVYTIEGNPDGNDPEDNWISKELCGGPHVERTGEIEKIEIFKEKSASAGVRRVYARLIGSN